jgi:hypothetical protein
MVNSETSQPALCHIKVQCETLQPAVPTKLKSVVKTHSQLYHTSWSPPWHLTSSCVTQALVHSETLQAAVSHKLKSILKPYSQLWHISWSAFWNHTAGCDTSWSPFWNLTACMPHKPKSVLKPQSQVCHITYSILEPHSQSHTASQNHITVYTLLTSHMILEPNRWQSKVYNSKLYIGYTDEHLSVISVQVSLSSDAECEDE